MHNNDLTSYTEYIICDYVVLRAIFSSYPVQMTGSIKVGFSLEGLENEKYSRHETIVLKQAQTKLSSFYCSKNLTMFEVDQIFL